MIILWKCLCDSVPLYSLLWFYGGYLHKYSPPFYIFAFWGVLTLVGFVWFWLVGFKAPDILQVCRCCSFIHSGFLGVEGFTVFGLWVFGWLFFFILFVVLYFVCFFPECFPEFCVFRTLLFFIFLEGLFILTVSLWVCYKGRCFFLCLFLSWGSQSGKVQDWSPVTLSSWWVCAASTHWIAV